jgi:hypothetical protein
MRANLNSGRRVTPCLKQRKQDTPLSLFKDTPPSVVLCHILYKRHQPTLGLFDAQHWTLWWHQPQNHHLEEALVTSCLTLLSDARNAPGLEPVCRARLAVPQHLAPTKQQQALHHTPDNCAFGLPQLSDEVGCGLCCHHGVESAPPAAGALPDPGCPGIAAIRRLPAMRANSSRSLDSAN